MAGQTSARTLVPNGGECNAPSRPFGGVSALLRTKSLINRYMENPSENHLLAAKRIFRYLKGTADLGIMHKAEVKSSLFGITNNDYVGDFEYRKSTSGYDEFWSCIMVIKETTDRDIVIHRS
ncbi:hypothetical protein CXB51_017857 [Gossypium anomalum]|uniref:Reverse transcriptase Ty1/copia-type domain-containing protein n=1 Tax=Gossypium anomalum TaxID=47600 RepID=A0A8J5YT17_9ROSI|nr:hypothetical protein CXB51_017857 [Gossypium anomalum]